MVLGKKLVETQQISFNLNTYLSSSGQSGDLTLEQPYLADSKGFLSLKVNLSEIGDRSSPARYAIISDYLTYQHVVNAKTYQGMEYDRFES